MLFFIDFTGINCKKLNNFFDLFIGVCLKTQDSVSGRKVFVNVCVSDQIQEPEHLSDKQLLDVSQFTMYLFVMP